MVTGIIGKKVGMTQLFLEDGTLEPATVIQAGPCIVVQSKSGQTDGYDAVQIGLVETKPFRSANKAIDRPSQEGQRAADARAARGQGRQGRRGAEARRPGAGLDLQPGRARRRHRHQQGPWLPGRRQAPPLPRRRRHARLDVPPRARLDWRLVVSVARHARHARARAHGRGPRDGAQPQGAEDRRREPPAARRRAPCPAPTAGTW